ncbi:FAD-dependent oxidoreductase [Dictyobacter aurantiacus]|uniref:FHA domain-containing protein n=1 Tax=Dictyobacter aurantiacus TaxID=1936993 RepID=A0A401ZDK1_9CHLR|nr:FAD-dependent oxidoreductase [Dictyobacter aurantiacus]GCE04919.1 hypothetical protein KDAU_22480 [Dictyobacter aurantiacus]
MADQISFLVIGNGIAGITAAETLRQEAPQATIGVISEDGHPVYFRPALKDYLAGRVVEEKLWARPINYYQSQHIHFLAERVTRIQPEQHIVLLQSGGQVKYEKLLLASGARPAHLTCLGSDLEGVFTLRSVEDYQAIVERLPSARRIVVVGSGTLALETVETLRHRGHQVSHLLRKSLLWSEVLDATASDLVLQEETRDGVDVRLETEVTEIVGSRGRVSAVQTSMGERITCDLVLVAIGIEPNIDYAQASGLHCRRGLLVDDQMRTSAIDVYAAGDVVETTMPGTQRARIIGQWYPSIQQARAAAYSMLNILDSSRPFHAATFYNATFLYGLPFASVGLTNARGYRELVAEPQPRSYRKVLLCDGVPVGMLALGDRKHTLAFKRAIDYQVNLASVASALMKEDFDLAAYLDRLQVPPLQLGVQRAGGTDTRHVIAIPGNGQEPRAGEDPMLHELLPSQHTEALLVHVADPHVPLHIAETALSREKFVTIGRQPGVNLVVNEGSISRRHAQLGFQNGHYVVIDLKSLNGTFLNEQRLDPERPYPLKVNDVLRFGNTVTFCFLLRPLNFDNLAPARQKFSAEPQPVRPPQQQELDENLLPVGAAQPLPPTIMKALKATPALIILPSSVKGERKQSPYVHLLKPKSSITIGREVGNDLEIHDMMISRRHAEVFSTMEGFYMRDLGSSNGVTINQGRIDQPYRLSHGDHIVLGSTTIFFIDLQSGQEKTSKLQSMAINPPVQRSPIPNGKKGSPAVRQPATGTETQVRMPAAAPVHATKPATRPPFPVVICPKCGVVNMPVARFCAGCSSSLHAS